MTLYHDDTDQVAEEANGTTVVCDFHIRGTIFDYRAGNSYRLEPVEAIQGQGAFGQESSDEQGSWRSDVISVPEGEWRLVIEGTQFHPEQTRSVIVRCPNGRTPEPTVQATPTPSPLPRGSVANSVQVLEAAPLAGDIAWVIAAKDESTLERTLYAVPLDGRPARAVLRYSAGDQGRYRDTNVIDRQLSPDGRRVVMSVWVQTASSFDLVIVDLQSGAVEELTATPHLHEMSPAWSPDGTLFAFARGQLGTWGAEIWRMRSDGSDARLFREGPCCNPSHVYDWTPDSAAIGYEAIGFEDSIYETRVLATDGIWTAGGTFLGGDWRLGTPAFVGAFDSSPRSPTESYLRLADGNGAPLRTIATARLDPTSPQGSFARPRWSPNGEMILVIRQAIISSIAVFSATGAEIAQPGSGRPFLAEWSPDGTTIVYVTPVPAGTGPPQVMVERLSDGRHDAELDNSRFTSVSTRLTDLAVRRY